MAREGAAWAGGGVAALEVFWRSSVPQCMLGPWNVLELH